MSIQTSFETEKFDRSVAEQSLESAMERLGDTVDDSIVDLSWNSPQGKWIVYFNGVQIDLLTGWMLNSDLDNRVQIGIKKIPSKEILSKYSLFYVCKECGKVYWDGTHMSRYMHKLGDTVKFQK